MSWISLYKKNSNYKNLLNANLISLFGDWFNFVAITTILFQLNENKTIVAYVFIIHLIPFIIFTPVAGILADKISRRKILLSTDILRFFVVLAYFPAIYFESNLSILALLFIQYSFATFFEPAKSALIPDIVTKKDLFTANSALAAVWSMMMSLGMAIGGIVVYLTSVEIALLFDAFTYLISYYFIKKMAPNETHFHKDFKIRLKDLIKLEDYFVSIKYLKDKLYMIPVVLSKAVLEIFTGAFLFFLTLYGEMDLKILGSAALSIGLLQAARGIGTGVGPILFRKIIKSQKQEYLILPFCLILIPTAYYFMAMQSVFWIALIFVFIAHMGGGANWVISENLIHHVVPNNIRGRIISFEYLLFTIVMTISIKVGSIMIDTYQMSLKDSTTYVAEFGIMISIIWLIITYLFYTYKFPKTNDSHNS